MYAPNLFTYVAMYGFLVYAVYLFSKYPLRSAIVTVVITGWIFLPQAKLAIPHIPYHTRTNAISMAVLLGVVWKEPNVFKKFRFSWVDIPMACWCFAPLFSSITNDLGVYDGLNGIEFQTVDYGIPYLIGRLYFGTYKALDELAIGMVIGAVVLLPLVLIELKISPQLHTKVYGWYPHDFIQSMRDGAYRPSVFMSHGLELAIWNAAAAFAGWQLFLRKVIPKKLPLLGIPTMISLTILTIALALSHSTGALALFLIAMLVFQIVAIFRSKLPLIIILIVPLLYMSLRGTGAWSGENLLKISIQLSGSEERGRSLKARLDNEKILVEKACVRLPFGWGPYQRSFVTDSFGNYISVPDGRWVVVLGENGLFGLASFSAFMLLPALLYFIKCPIKEFASRDFASSSTFALCLCMTMIDNMFNAMSNPVLIFAAGGLLTFVLSPKSKSLTRQDENAQISEFVLIPGTRTI